MKRSFATLFVTLSIFAVLAPETVASDPDSALEKLKTIVIPLVEFKDAPFAEALDLLEGASVAHDKLSPPSKRGVKIIRVRLDAKTARVPVTVRLSNVTLGEAIRYTAAAADFEWRIERNLVFVVPRKAGDEGAADDIWFAAFMTLQSSETLENEGLIRESRGRLVEARAYYNTLRAHHPGYRPKIIEELLRQIDKKLANRKNVE